MKSGYHTILIIISLLLLVIAAGCSFIPFTGPGETGQKGSTDIGFSPGNLTPETTAFPFDDAMRDYSRQVADYGNTTAQPADAPWQIHYIHGMAVDPSGNAGRWVFVAGRGDSALLFSYDKYGGTLRGWNETLLSNTVPLDTMLAPAAIFSQNRAIIFLHPQEPTPDLVELELTNSTYTLTISNRSGMRTLEFDALSGALTGTK